MTHMSIILLACQKKNYVITISQKNMSLSYKKTSANKVDHIFLPHHVSCATFKSS
jgi:hypothetical protein